MHNHYSNCPLKSHCKTQNDGCSCRSTKSQFRMNKSCWGGPWFPQQPNNSDGFLIAVNWKENLRGKWEAVKSTFTGTQIKGRRLQTSRGSSLHFPVLNHPALLHSARVQCPDSRGINVHTLSKNRRQESRIASRPVVWNAEGRTSPFYQNAGSAAALQTWAQLHGLARIHQGLKTEMLLILWEAFLRAKKGFDSERNSCSSIKVREPSIGQLLCKLSLSCVHGSLPGFWGSPAAVQEHFFHRAASLGIAPVSQILLEAKGNVFSPTDCSNEKWCRDYFLSSSALSMAGMIRAELLEIMKRIELPISEPAFGAEGNLLSIKKALLSGYFMHVRKNAVISSSCTVKLCRMLSENLSSLVKSLDHQKG